MEKMSLNQINEILTNLHIFELDNSLGEFWKHNCKYFLEENLIESSEENGYYFMRETSSLEVKFLPSCLNIEQIRFDLKNLSGNSIRSYIVSLEGNNILISQNSQLISLNGSYQSVRKTTIDSGYIDLKKSYDRKLDSITSIKTQLLTQKNENIGVDFTKEIETYYPNLDSDYLKKIIIISDSSSVHPTNVKYLKGTDEFSQEKEISELDYINGISNKTNKVLMKVFK